MSLSFKEFLNEAVFKNDEFTKKINKKEKYGGESITYGKAVIDKLLGGSSVRLGDYGKAGSFDIKHLGELADKLRVVDSVDKFNFIINGYDPDNLKGIDDKKLNEIKNNFKYRWTKIFKGDFSGNPDGPSTKGHSFEEEFLGMINAGIEAVKKEQKPSDQYEKLIGVIGKGAEIKLESAKHDGTNNTKRPFNFSKDDGFWIGEKNNLNIGKTISDITVKTSDNQEVYLSLKFGRTTSVLNLGVERLFSKDFFEGSKLGDETGAKKLLECLCIDEDKFRRTFVSYSKMKNKKDAKTRKPDEISFKEVVKQKDDAKEENIEVDIVGEFKENEAFKNLILQAFGYGYILVHKSGGKNGNITYRDFRDKDTVENYIMHKGASKFKSGKVLYGGKSGKGKRVQVEVNYSDVLMLSVVIRNTNAEIYPDKMQVMYKFMPENISKN